MPAQLLALTDGPSILLDKPIFLVGRDLECDIRFDSRKVSRKHCCIAQVSDYLVVRDLGSTNGIRINGVRVLEGRLRPGDELTIAHYRYQVRWDEQAAPLLRAPQSVHADATSPSGDDAMLEMCDEPVPLSDSAGGPNMPEAARAAKPNPPPEQPKVPSPFVSGPLAVEPASSGSWHHHPKGPAI